SDGTRNLGTDENDKILAWDGRSGQLLAGAVERMPDAGYSSPRLQVSIEDGLIRVRWPDLEEKRKQRDRQDRERLERLTPFQADRHGLHLGAALQVGDDFAAAFHLDRLVRSQPKDAALHVHLAHALARLDRRQESATHLARATALDPRISPWPIDPGAAPRGR